MIVNYFLLAFRNVTKQRGYAIVNMLGLAVGLASALFILLYVKDELTFDTMHPSAASTYRMGYTIQFPNGEKEAAPYAPAGWDNYIQANYEGIGGITSYDSYGMPTSIHYEPKDRIILTEDIRRHYLGGSFHHRPDPSSHCQWEQQKSLERSE